VLNNGIGGQLKADISRSEAQLQQLSTRLGDNHPQVVELRPAWPRCARGSKPKRARSPAAWASANTINRQREAEIRARWKPSAPRC
jgi:succinoglycan biosynthesis transport protein ExoP